MRGATGDKPYARNQAPAGQGSNSLVVRRFNERLILATLRRLGDASKADIARHTSLTQNTVGLIASDLVARGLVHQVGRREGQRGQPAMLLALAPDGTCSIGVKMGRGSICAVLVDFGGAILHTIDRERPLPGPAEALAETRAIIADMRAVIPRRARGRLAGIGLAIPHDLDSWRRELDLPGDHLAAWQGHDFAAALRAHLDLPLLVENDGTAVAVAELFRGHGRTIDDFVSLHIASALGGGIVLGGQYRSGFRGNAGDIGLMPASGTATLPNGAPAFEILLARASIRSLVRHLRDHGRAVVTRRDLEVAMEQSPDLLTDWLDTCAAALVEPLLSIAAVLDVDAIVIDGDLDAALIARLLAQLSTLMSRAAPEARQAPALLQGTIGRNAAAIGAAILPLHHNFTPDQRTLLGVAA